MQTSPHGASSTKAKGLMRLCLSWVLLNTFGLFWAAWASLSPVRMAPCLWLGPRWKAGSAATACAFGRGNAAPFGRVHRLMWASTLQRKTLHAQRLGRALKALTVIAWLTAFAASLVPAQQSATSLQGGEL